MPRQTNIRWRRDTAANWSSANPVLAAGEIGYTTDTKVLKIGDGVTAWNSLLANAQAGSALEYRPLNSTGAYLSGSGLVLPGALNQYASAPDSAALSVTGDLDLRCKLAMTDWTPAVETWILGKWVTSTNNRSYLLSVQADGKLQFRFSDNGTNNLNRGSTVATGFTDGATKWIRATLDVDNGASGHDVAFYTSDDGVAWTQLGATVTNAGVTSVFDSTAIVEVGSIGAGVANLAGTVYRAQILNGIGGTTAFDANFETAIADAVAFTGTSNTGIKSDGLVLVGRTGEYASAPDSAALSITGDIDIKVKVKMDDWTPATQQAFVGKFQTVTQRSFTFLCETNGTISLYWSTNGTGTTNTVSSSVATGLTDGTTKWVRATLDVDNGATQNVVKFYTSDDGTTWAQLGTTRTNAGVTNIFDSTSTVEVGSLIAGTSLNLSGTIYRTIIQSAYDTANNTASLVFDADFDAQTPETVSFTESSSNAATVTVIGTNPLVTINTTRYSYGIPEVQWSATGTGNANATVIYYMPFVINAPISVDMFLFEVTTTPASTAEHRIGIYRSDNNCQPTGAIVTDSGPITVLNGQIGIFSRQITPVVLQPGIYLLTHKSSVTTAVRLFRGGTNGIVFNIGASAMNTAFYTNQAIGPFPSAGTKWISVGGSSSPAVYYSIMRYSPV